MNYTWNFQHFTKAYLSVVIRKPRMVALLYALVWPIKLLYDSFTEFRVDVNNTVMFTGQTASFETVLNNLFDNNLRRIYILTDGDAIAIDYTFNRTEGRAPIFVRNRSEASNGQFTYFRAEDVVGDYDVKIYVPAAIVAAQSARLNAWVKYYLMYNKTYQIISI